MAIRESIRRHPVLAYFALTFAISWGGVLSLGAPSGMPAPSEVSAKTWPFVFLPYFVGPILSGLLLTGLVHGRAGFGELRARFSKWRVGAGWYAVALLTAPLLIAPMLLALSMASSDFLPRIITTADKAGVVLSGIMVGLVFGGLMEELGWTGFATPELRRRQSVLATGLIVGIMWGVWHILPTFWASGDASGGISLDLQLPPLVFYLGVLPVYRVLMVLVHDRTWSLPVVILMHASLTASTLFILAPSVDGMLLSAYYAILTAALAVVVAAVAGAKRRRLSRQPLQERQGSRAGALAPSGMDAATK